MTRSATIVMRIPAAAVAAGSDLTSPIGSAPVSGTIVGVRYTPTSTAGSGTTLAATKAFLLNVNIAANTAGEIVKSATAANRKVIAGDVLDWESLHVGATGLADPGGLVEVEILPDRHGGGI